MRFKHPEQLCNNISCLVTREFLLWLLFCSRCLVLLQCCSLGSQLPTWFGLSHLLSQVTCHHFTYLPLVRLFSCQFCSASGKLSPPKKGELNSGEPNGPGAVLPRSEHRAMLSWCELGCVQAVVWCSLPLQGGMSVPYQPAFPLLLSQFWHFSGCVFSWFSLLTW